MRCGEVIGASYEQVNGWGRAAVAKLGCSATNFIILHLDGMRAF
jgi:hypothetical protein